MLGELSVYLYIEFAIFIFSLMYTCSQWFFFVFEKGICGLRIGKIHWSVGLTGKASITVYMCIDN